MIMRVGGEVPIPGRAWERLSTAQKVSGSACVDRPVDAESNHNNKHFPPQSMLVQWYPATQEMGIFSEHTMAGDIYEA